VLVRAALVLALAVALADGKAVSRLDARALDGAGRAMLDPIRVEALRPDALLARLGLAPDAQVADVGAGPGFFTLRLARLVPRGRVLATDVRADYLAYLKRAAGAAGLSNIEVRVVSGDDAGLAPGSLDLILLSQVDHLVRERARLLAPLVAALRPGGRLVVVNYVRFRAPLEAAALAAGLIASDQWSPSPPFYVEIFHR
jgi:SAM-dependent methyltransferase